MASISIQRKQMFHAYTCTALTTEGVCYIIYVLSFDSRNTYCDWNIQPVCLPVSIPLAMLLCVQHISSWPALCLRADLQALGLPTELVTLHTISYSMLHVLQDRAGHMQWQWLTRGQGLHGQVWCWLWVLCMICVSFEFSLFLVW